MTHIPIESFLEKLKNVNLTVKKIMTIPKIENCARCDGTHLDIAAKKFEILPDIIIDGIQITHWAQCPTTGDPILIASYEPEP